MSTTQDFAAMLNALFRTVLQASWQGGLAILLVLLVSRVLGARVPARWRYLLWLLVLARLLVPTFLLPRSHTSLENIAAVAEPFKSNPVPPASQRAPERRLSPVPHGLTASPRSTRLQPSTATAPTVTWSHRSWPLFAAMAWLVGAVSLCLWLLACSCRLRRRMHRETLPTAANIVVLWHSCCRRWLRRAPPQVLTVAWAHSPALVGVWRPALLLPGQMPGSFSAEDWEHVFAHEIAHLRWRDHWVQLWLHLACCVHWFNPLVWLGLRRLRADRELAADEWALQHLAGERALAYGETLFKTLANRPTTFSFQPGMVGISEDGAQIEQRLRRITAFLPQRRLSGSFAGLVAVLLLATVVLGQGSSDQPFPQQRISGLAATKKPAPALHKSFVNEGRVLMADGTPLGPDPITAYTHYEGLGNGEGVEVVRDGLFYLDVPYDEPDDTTTITVAVEQRGCAVAFTGPLTLENLDKLGHLEVKLARGYNASVQIVDEGGRAVPGALLRPYHPGPPLVELTEIRTDAAGIARLEHLGEAPLNLRVSADGFQADEVTSIHLDPVQPYRLTLKPTQPLRGTVTAAASGKAIAGAVIKLGGVRGPHDEDHYDPKKAPVLTTADAQGRFVLASLRPDSRYYLFVEAPGYGGAYLRGVILGPGELNVALGPELTIRGKIIHAPPAVIHLDKVYLRYGQAFDIGDNFTGQTGEDLDLQPVNGEADFTVGPFYKVYGETIPSGAKPIELYVDSWGTARFSIDQLPVSNFVFDLARQTNDRSPPKPEAAAERADAEGNTAPKTGASPAASPAG